MREQATQIFARILDMRQHAACRQRAGIADLPAALGIKGRLIDDDLDRLARPGALDPRAILDDRDDLPFALFAGVPDEFGAPARFGNVEPHIVRSALARSLPRGPRCALLLRHGGVEPGAIDAETFGPQRVLGQIIGKAVSIIKFESHVTRQGIQLGANASAHCHRGCIPQLFNLVGK